VKTLFAMAEIQGGAAAGATYRLLDQVQLMRVGRHHVVVNPDIGSWAVLDEGQEEDFSSWRNGLILPEVGEFLLGLGMCSRDGVTATYHTSSSYMDEMYFFEFLVTEQCNLDCVYCFADASPHKPPSAIASCSVAELFVDRIAEHRAKTNSLSPVIIEFTGGEALLNFDVVRHTIEYAKKNYGDLLNFSFTIQSNGIALTQDHIDFLREHGVGLGISCDGFRSLHDSHRPLCGGQGSHDRLIQKIKMLVERYPENAGSIISVISGRSQAKMSQILLYLHTLGYNEVSFRPMVSLGRGARDNLVDDVMPSAYGLGLLDLLDDVIEPMYKSTGIMLREHYLSLTFQYLLSPNRPFMCERTPCGGGRNISIVTPSGDVYPCNQSIRPEFHLGNLAESSFVELMRAPNAEKMSSRDPSQITPCRECAFRGWCASPCPIAVFQKHNSLNHKSPYCEIQSTRYAAGLERLLDGKDDLSFIGKLIRCVYPIEWKMCGNAMP
jgi:uncharacterized protein